jgi:hypothetical protein
MSWSKGALLSFSEVIIRVLVKSDLTNWNERIVRVRDYLGNIKDVELVVFTFLFGDNLNVPGPRGEVALGNILEQILGGIVLVGTSGLSSLLRGHVLDTLVSFKMILHIEDLTLFVDPSVGVGTVSIHVSVSIRSTAVREEDSNLVKGVGGVGPEVPSHVGILEAGLRVSLLGVNEVGELDGVLDEENWSVVSNHIVVALFSIELNGESTRISLCISRAKLSSYS